MEFMRTVFRPNGRERVGSVEDALAEKPGTIAPTATSQVTTVAGDDKLSVFRHLVGIYSAQSFAPTTTKAGNLPDLSHNNLHANGRAAPNLGIYNRVVHREQEAKRGYKFASLLINSCLGIQVIVAAALTALGAANSSHRAVTAFGAINTVIAGILTYLKGSGLPNRIKYYENEWKRIREYIEQRERDFSRPDCLLDVYEVVKVVEAMYEEVRVDIQTNTPENYVSVGDLRARTGASMHPIPKLPPSTVSAPENKIKQLEMKYGHKVEEILETLAKKEGERLATFEKELDDHKTGAVREAQGIEQEIESTVSKFGEMSKELEAKVDRRRESDRRG